MTSSINFPSITAPLDRELAELFSENVFAKTYRTASHLTKTTGLPKTQAAQSDLIPVEHVPTGYPEYVPQDGTDIGCWVVRKTTLWTCGFFPGTVYTLLERMIKYPLTVYKSDTDPEVSARLQSDYTALANFCIEPLYKMAERTDTHDIGFMIMPALQRRWELMNDIRSLHSIRQAAQSLATRFIPSAGAIRSWDTCIQKNRQITSTAAHLILIIDSACNLDLMYYAASHFPQDSRLADIATMHANTLLRTHLRPEIARSPPSDAYKGQWYSAHHVADLDPSNGSVKQHFTAQGYSDTSTWARGQSWGILGFAQTYMWTKDMKFLEAACGLSENFLQRMDSSPSCVETSTDDRTFMGRYVPLWDFDAPIDDEANPIRDSSAAAVAANGMLIISQALAGLGQHQLSARFRVAALYIARDLAHFAMSTEKARFAFGVDTGITVEDSEPGRTFEGLIKYGTANNNDNATVRYANHSLVYGDYYSVELGNRMLRMGLV